MQIRGEMGRGRWALQRHILGLQEEPGPLAPPRTQDKEAPGSTTPLTTQLMPGWD